MSTIDYKDLEHMLHTFVFPFYKISRDMPLTFRPETHENDAEHSWSLAFFAMLLTPYIDEGLDSAKVLQYAIIHDLVEIYAGDVSVHDHHLLKPGQKEANEKKALHDIKNESPQFPHLYEICRDYEHQIDPEAVYIKALDKVVNWLTSIPSYEAGIYAKRGITKADFQRAIGPGLQKSKPHPKMHEYMQKMLEIFAEHPEWMATTEDGIS